MYSLNSTNRDLAELRSMQDWYLKYQLTVRAGRVGSGLRRRLREAIPGHGGSDETARLQPVALNDVSRPSNAATARSAAGRWNWRNSEFILRVKGYVDKPGRSEESRRRHRRQAACRFCCATWPTIQFGPDMRRGIAEANGEGETVGGIVVVRYGANAHQVIQDVKARLDAAMKALAGRMCK